MNGAGAQLASLPRYSGYMQMVERNPKSDFFSNFQSSIFLWGHIRRSRTNGKGSVSQALSPSSFKSRAIAPEDSGHPTIRQACTPLITASAALPLTPPPYRWSTSSLCFHSSAQIMGADPCRLFLSPSQRAWLQSSSLTTDASS